MPFRRSSSERRTEQFPKAAAFGAFSWFVLCRVAKNEHQNRYSARAKQCAPGCEDVGSLAKPSATSSLDARTANAPRCAVAMPFLCHSTKKWRKKGNQRAQCPLDSRNAPRKITDFSDRGAKGYIFSFCERDLKKVALTGVARTPLLQTTSVFASFPVMEESSSRTG